MTLYAPYPPVGPHAAKSPARSQDDGDPQPGAGWKSVVVVGKLARALAGRYAVTSRPQGGGGVVGKATCAASRLALWRFPCVTVSPNGYTTRRLGGLLLRARHLCLDGTGKALVLGTIRIPSFSLIYRSRASSMASVQESTCWATDLAVAG